jgi:hypothetical protein
MSVSGGSAAIYLSRDPGKYALRLVAASSAARNARASGRFAFGRRRERARFPWGGGVDADSFPGASMNQRVRSRSRRRFPGHGNPILARRWVRDRAAAGCASTSSCTSPWSNPWLPGVLRAERARPCWRSPCQRAHGPLQDMALACLTGRWSRLRADRRGAPISVVRALAGCSRLPRCGLEAFLSCTAGRLRRGHALTVTNLARS